MKKRLFGVMLAIALMVITLCVISVPAFAAGSGSCGDSLTYTLSSDGTLTVSGTGDMADWTYSSTAPWYSERESINSVVISSGVTGIGSYAFYNCTNLKTVTIPGSVTDIGEYSFYNCTSVESIDIPQNVATIANGTFNNCASLVNIVIPDSVTSIGDWAFFECTALTDVSFGSGVKTIGKGAFSLCSALTSVTVPSGVTAIGDVAFWNCGKLKTIAISDTVRSIGDYAFNDTEFYTTDSNWESGVLYAGNHLIKAKSTVSGEYTVKSGTKVIADYAFSDAKGITAVTLTTGVATIGNYAFSNCSELADVYYLGTEEGWNAITIGSDNAYLTEAELHYVAPKTYTVTFDANGGINPPASQTKQQGTPLTLSKDVPEYSGYVFVNWKDGNGNTYAPGAKYTDDSDVVLTAVWKKVGGTTGKLDYGDVNADGSVSVSDVILLLQMIASDGFDSLTNAQLIAADVDCNNTIDVSDVIRILQYLASPGNTHLGPKGMIQFLGKQGEATAEIPAEWRN